MATVTGVSAERANEIEANSIVNASLQGSDLVFETHGGTQINVGRIIQETYKNWPVGSIFMNTGATNPASLLGGGTWIRWGKGRVPVSVDEAQAEFDAPEETGGAKTVTLTVAQMPTHSHGGATDNQSNDHTHSGTALSSGAHVHTTPNHTHPNINVSGNVLDWASSSRQPGSGATVVADGDSPITVGNGGGGFTSEGGNHIHNVTTNGASANHTHAITAEGGGQPHSILSPYITVYMWKRTA